MFSAQTECLGMLIYLHALKVWIIFGLTVYKYFEIQEMATLENEPHLRTPHPRILTTPSLPSKYRRILVTFSRVQGTAR